jgi:hypothetical protein
MIIIGCRTRLKEVGMGRFHCPACKSTQTYRRKRMTQYFTLYFIPIFPMGSLGEHVQCQRCRRAWRPEVLDREPILKAAPPNDPLNKAINARVAASNQKPSVRLRVDYKPAVTEGSGSDASNGVSSNGKHAR